MYRLDKTVRLETTAFHAYRFYGMEQKNDVLTMSKNNNVHINPKSEP